jgi:hypothetical protein
VALGVATKACAISYIGLVVGAARERQKSRASEVLRCLVAGHVATELLPIHRCLSHAKPPLPPHYPGKFLHQVLFGRPIRCVFGHHGIKECPVFGLVLPRQDRVTRQHTMAECVETRVLVAGVWHYSSL